MFEETTGNEDLNHIQTSRKIRYLWLTQRCEIKSTSKIEPNNALQYL